MLQVLSNRREAIIAPAYLSVSKCNCKRARFGWTDCGHPMPGTYVGRGVNTTRWSETTFIIKQKRIIQKQTSRHTQHERMGTAESSAFLFTAGKLLHTTYWKQHYACVELFSVLSRSRATIFFKWSTSKVNFVCCFLFTSFWCCLIGSFNIKYIDHVDCCLLVKCMDVQTSAREFLSSRYCFVHVGAIDFLFFFSIRQIGTHICSPFLMLILGLH